MIIITKAIIELERSMKLASDRKEYNSANDFKRILELLSNYILKNSNCPICEGKMTSFKQTHYHCKKCNESFTN